MVPFLQKVTIHERIGGSGYGKGGRLVFLALSCEGDPEPFSDWLTINFGYGVDGGSSEMDPHLGKSEVVLK